MKVKKVIGIIGRVILIVIVGPVLKPSFYIRCIPDVFKGLWLEARG